MQEQRLVHLFDCNPVVLAVKMWKCKQVFKWKKNTKKKNTNREINLRFSPLSPFYYHHFPCKITQKRPLCSPAQIWSIHGQSRLTCNIPQRWFLCHSSKWRCLWVTCPTQRHQCGRCSCCSGWWRCCRWVLWHTRLGSSLCSVGTTCSWQTPRAKGQIYCCVLIYRLNNPVALV